MIWNTDAESLPRAAMKALQLERLRATVGLILRAVPPGAERLRVSAPVTLAPKVWYRLKTRVDIDKDGTAMVRAKVWKRGDAEPADWTIEVKHEHRCGDIGTPGPLQFTVKNVQYRASIPHPGEDVMRSLKLQLIAGTNQVVLQV